MKIATLLISDGREDCLRRTMNSAQLLLPPTDYFFHVNDAAHKLGFGGAIREGWRRVLATDVDYVFHLEQDFTFRRWVDLAGMIRVLEHHPHLVQMALLRQPWNADERRAGGIIEQHPDSYHTVRWEQFVWREHRRFVTTNPSLWPRWVLERGWPDCDQSEGHFGIELFGEAARYHAAFWGDIVWCDHIGETRAGTGY